MKPSRPGPSSSMNGGAPDAPSQVQVRTDKLENATSLQRQPNTEPDLAGYRVVWRATTADQWQGAQDVGNVSVATCPTPRR
ncbi:hypothetical protein [Janthinobacterium psychrotolerans]|nr:hypothetical protein [Janthinobacterium psychrotolerans]